MFAFEFAASDPRIVGVNLVMPEDWFFSMRFESGFGNTPRQK
jgi:hypothetical protein